MNYQQLLTAIQSYTENQFPPVYLSSGAEVSSTQQINRFIEQAEQRIYNTVQIPPLRKNVTGTTTANNKYLACPDDFLAPYSLAVIDAVSGEYLYLLNKDVNFIREAYPSPTATGKPRYYAIFGSQSAKLNELTLILGPTPDLAYYAELHYYYYPVSIVQNVMTAFTGLVGGSGYVNGRYVNLPVSNLSSNGDGAVVDVLVEGNTITEVSLIYGGSGYLIGDTLTVNNDYLGGSGINLSFTVSAVDNTTGTSWLGDNFDMVLLYGSLVEAYMFMKGDQDMLDAYTKKYNEALALLKRLGDGMDRQDAYRSGQVRVQVT